MLFSRRPLAAAFHLAPLSPPLLLFFASASSSCSPAASAAAASVSGSRGTYALLPCIREDFLCRVRILPTLLVRFSCYLTGFSRARCSALYTSDLTQTLTVVSKEFPNRVCGFHWVTRCTLASRDAMPRLWIFVGI